MSFLREIFHDYVTGPLKFRIIRAYLEDQGFYLGLLGDYDSERLVPRHHGTLVVCKKQPTGLEETPAMALYPTTDPDMVQLPDHPITVIPFSTVVEYGTIDVPLKVALASASRAMKMLNDYSVPDVQQRTCAA